jgi:mono/diheme cytochrome c family protein
MRWLQTVDRVLAPLVWLAAGLLALMLFIGPRVVANDQPASQQAAAPYAQQLFVSNCGGCHTLSAAGTSGAIGPSLDGLGLQAPAVAAQVASGGGGMPAFRGRLGSGQIQAIGAYVAGASKP